MKVIYRGKFSTIIEEKVRTKSGMSYTHPVTVGSKIIAILPIFNNGDVLLEKQYRHAIRKWIYEIPAGHADKGENRQHAAKRELEEETGYTTSQIKQLCVVYENPAGKRDPMHIYIATDLKNGTKHLEDSERITTFRVSPKRAVSMVRSNRIMDLKTITAILFYYGITQDRGRKNLK